MTSIYFVRHAQPNDVWTDDRTKPLTILGIEDIKKVTEILEKNHIDVFFSSPYKRSVDTILDCANKLNMKVHTDEKLRERKQGIKNGDFLERLWGNFNFCEENGETLNSVQERNIAVLKEILHDYKDKNIVIGTHGTALSTIINFYVSSFNCDNFKRIWFSIPYIIRLDFENESLQGKTELLSIERGY